MENKILVEFLRKHSFYRFGAVIQLEKSKARNLEKRGIVKYI